MTRIRWERSFQKALFKLPADLQQAALDALEKLLEEPPRPSLRLEKLQGASGYWSIRVNRGWRILLRLEDGEEGKVYVVLDVGPHDVYRSI
jgi:mRNA-degrading endonuclease RelE of RelBE toxin-antitoxin system